ncbi:hypothetical protein Pla144_45490 [Bythopirellula polymerisocia]|uniref:Uncharacterized protein n=1 Tax=Bythopirellula polymerisocia TaxID=2528003 RepID=A0A5C6CAT9_9BACT|nr:hypothetical protein Pla144_45490 [Bythopirellula polymerisocia]
MPKWNWLTASSASLLQRMRAIDDLTEINRGRMTTRLIAGSDSKISFNDLAALLSLGNLNTSALRLFLKLNIIEQPKASGIN